MTISLFDGYIPGDAALENSHWMARRTSEKLGDEAKLLTHPDAKRAQLEAHLDEADVTGLVLFGHGDPGKLHTALRAQHHDSARKHTEISSASAEGAVYGCDDNPALDADNIHLLRGRWCHAMACSVGLSLPDRAVEAGAICFVAYETALTPEFEVTSLPASLHSLLGELVTLTTLKLHAGIHDEGTLKRGVEELKEKLVAWLEDEEGESWRASKGFMFGHAVLGFANQLWRCMRLVRASEPTSASH